MSKRAIFVFLDIAIVVFFSGLSGAEMEGVYCVPEPGIHTVQYGDMVLCAIDPIGDLDTYTFFGNQSEVVIVRVTSAEGGAAYVTVYDPDGISLGSALSVLTLTVEQTGTHTILVEEFMNNQTMQYNLSLERISPASFSNPPICAGCTISDEIDPLGDLDPFVFYGTEGETFVVRATSIEGGTAYVTVYGPDGASLGSDLSALTLTVEQTGTHTILVEEFMNNQIMQYNLVLQCVGTCITPPDDEPSPSMPLLSGRVVDAQNGEAISSAELHFSPGSLVLTSGQDGSFSSSQIPAGAYTVLASAIGYEVRNLAFTLSSGVSNQLHVNLTPYAPKIISARAFPSQIYSDGASSTLLTVTVSNPSGTGSVSSVSADLSWIGGSAQQTLYDNGTHGDIQAGDGTYSYLTSVKPGTSTRLYSLKVKAVDDGGQKGFGSIALDVKEKVSGSVQPSQTDSKRFKNPLGGQTLRIRFFLTALRTPLGLKDKMSECQVALTIHGPNGFEDGPYYVSDSLDITIPDAEEGDWEYITRNSCGSDLSYEIETAGSGTGTLVGRVVDGFSGNGLAGASITCNMGGSTVSLDQGYYCGVAVAGTGQVISNKTGYQTNIRNGVHVRAGGTTTLNIQLVAADSPGQGAPSDKKVLAILNPSDQPNPPTQPFAGRLLGSSIEFNLLFPPYQEAVDLYVGLTINSPDHAGKIYLLREDNTFIEFSGTLQAWRKGVKDGQSAQVLVPAMTREYPLGDYTLYTLVTTDSTNLSNYELGYFVEKIAQTAPSDQEVAVIENPGADPAPLTQPVAASIKEGTLSLNACYPLQEQPITIILAYATPQGELFLIKPDGSKEPFTGTIWPWRSGVVEQPLTEVMTVPFSELEQGPYTFFSMVTTNSIGLGNYDLIYFVLQVVK